jgi:hypothetical protein
VRVRREVIWPLALYTLFALNFGAYRVFGDGEMYFSFDQHLFGDRPDGTAYNFGTGILNAPFYAVGKVGDAVGLHSPHGGSLTAPMITLASIAYVLLAAWSCMWLVRQLDLPARGLAVCLAVFGTPIWYYGSFSPSYSHATDTFVLTAAACVLLLVWRGGGVRVELLLGALFGLSLAVRPANAGFVAGVVLALACFRRWRTVAATSGATAAAFGLLVLLPYLMGLPLNKRLDGTVIGSAHDSFRGSYTGKIFGFAPLTPIRMLFSDHRGLFIWTPATAIAVIGIVLLLRRRFADRGYVVALCAGAVTLLLSHVSLVFWDGGWSFSMRYLAALLPLYAIGIAAVLNAVDGRWRTVAVSGLVVATLWSVWLGTNHAFGGMGQGSGASRSVTLYTDGTKTPGDYLRNLWAYSRLRHVVDRLP